MAGQDGWGAWQEAKSLYDSGRYGEAFEKLKAAPHSSANYFYNLGTLSYQTGKLGAAVAYFEKANRLRPHDSDIQHNLRISRSKLGRLIGQEKLDPASSWIEATADHFPLDEVRGTLGLLAFILTVFWIRAYLKQRSLLKTLLLPSGALAALAFLVTTLVYGAQRLADATPPAICLEHEVIRSGPGDQYLALGRAESGVKLRLLGPVATSSSPLSSPTNPSDPAKSGELWRQVRYSPSGIGWVRDSSLLLL